VLEVGDSLGIDLGWGLQNELARTGPGFVGEAVGDTGLAETWYYNWQFHLASEVRQYHPAVVVVFLGANDVENLYVAGRLDEFGSRAWALAYGQRVAGLIDVATGAGARVLWVGMPPMADPNFSADMTALNAVYAKVAGEHAPGAAYFPAAAALGGPGGAYEQTAPAGGGQGSEVRDPDGVHITWAGAQVLAKAVVTDLRKRGWL
jgi:hypothetical protein